MLLITGGSGFIGKYLSAHILLNTSEKIKIFSSSPDKFHAGLEDILLSAMNHILQLGLQLFELHFQAGDVARFRRAKSVGAV